MSASPTVFLAMDFQEGIVERMAGAPVIAAEARALEAARAHGIPVMFVRVAFRAGYPEAAASHPTFGRLAERGDAMVETAAATQIHAELAPLPGEPVITKRRVSAFTGSDLDVLLRAARAENLVLTGISTSGVVLSTLIEASDLDFRLTVLEDACADGDPEVHRVLTEKVFPKRAVVTTVDAWAATLD